MTRLVAVLAVLVLGVTACGSGVPDDQAVKPGKAPDGWKRTDLGRVSVAAPSDWTKGPAKKASDTMQITTWRAALVDGKAPAGLEVRVISRPQQNARKAARALAISAMAVLHAGQVEPDEIVWPNARSAYYLHYDATTGQATGAQETYRTRTMVLDLDGGGQVQVTAIAAKGQDLSLPGDVLSTVQVPKSSDG